MSADYKADPEYRFYQGKHMESHLYEGIQAADFYDKLENFLSPSFKTALPALRAELGMAIRLLTYKWPNGSQQQTEKQPSRGKRSSVECGMSMQSSY
jgi:hypothetical protein